MIGTLLSLPGISAALDSAAGTFTLLLFLIVAACGTTFMALLVIYRNRMIIKMSQPRFSVVFILALVLNVLSIVVQLGPNETLLACMGHQWLFHLSFNLAFGSLMVKVYRVYRLLSNKVIARFVDK